MKPSRSKCTTFEKILAVRSETENRGKFTALFSWNDRRCSAIFEAIFTVLRLRSSEHDSMYLSQLDDPELCR